VLPEFLRILSERIILKLVKRFDYPPLDRVTYPDGTRFYTCPVTGEAVPSCTTVISATSSKKEALKEWQEWVGVVRADKERLHATNLGTLVHTHLEKYIMGEERPRGNLPMRMLSARMADVVIAKGLIDIDEVWGIEVGMFYPGLYAGTTDVVCVYKGKPTIVDFKTAKKMRTIEMIEDDYSAQLGAYAKAHNHVYGTEIDTGIIMMVSRDLEYKAFEFNNIQAAGERFFERFETYIAGQIV
jgi:hypothetical protein